MIITCTLCSERKGSNKFCSSQKKAADSVCRACGKSTEVSTLYIAIDEQGKGDIHLFRDEQDATTYCSTIGALVQETKAFPSLMATRMGDPLQKVQVSGENPRKVYMVCLYDFRGCIADILTTTHREDTAKQFLKCFKLNGAGAFEAKNTYIRTAIVEDKLDNPNIATSRCHLSYSELRIRQRLALAPSDLPPNIDGMHMVLNERKVLFHEIGKLPTPQFYKCIKMLTASTIWAKPVEIHKWMLDDTLPCPSSICTLDNAVLLKLDRYVRRCKHSKQTANESEAAADAAGKTAPANMAEDAANLRKVSAQAAIRLASAPKPDPDNFFGMMDRARQIHEYLADFCWQTTGGAAAAAAGGGPPPAPPRSPPAPAGGTGAGGGLGSIRLAQSFFDGDGDQIFSVAEAASQCPTGMYFKVLGAKMVAGVDTSSMHAIKALDDDIWKAVLKTGPVDRMLRVLVTLEQVKLLRFSDSQKRNGQLAATITLVDTRNPNNRQIRYPLATKLDRQRFWAEFEAIATDALSEGTPTAVAGFTAELNLNRKKNWAGTDTESYGKAAKAATTTSALVLKTAPEDEQDDGESGTPLPQSWIKGDRTKLLCWTCGARARTKCSGCWKGRYCDAKCQTIGWKGGHKEECVGLGSRKAKRKEAKQLAFFLSTWPPHFQLTSANEKAAGTGAASLQEDQPA